MIKNYFKTALRNLWKSKGFSAINIFGLAIGLACCILMFLFIRNELSFDKFHKNAGNIYRITSIAEAPDGKTNLAVTPAPWAPLMKKDYPEIKNYLRILKDEKSLIGEPGKEHYYENGLIFCDSTFFDVFSFSLLKGDPKHALEAPNSIILTKESAEKYFGKDDPINKTLEVTTSFGRTLNLRVTGVANQPPANSHFNFHALVSMQTLGDISNFWSYHMFHSYVVMAGGVQRNLLEKKLNQFSEKYINHNPNADGKQEIHLQPLVSIHLHSKMVGELGINGDMNYIYVFSGVALFVLLIACFNFLNLSTVRSFQRAKEVGLRKVVGAERGQLVKQFLGESLLVSFAALILSLLITVLALPLFNQLSERSLNLSFRNDYYLMLLILLLVLFVGIIAGIYPAFVLSSFKPAEVLKGKFQKGSKGNLLRKGLVSFQFVISISLIASTIIIYKQLKFIQTKEIGFDKNKMLVISLPRGGDADKLTGFKSSLLKTQGIVSASAASSIPGTEIPINQVHNENAALNNNSSMQMLFVDHDFIKTMEMKIIAGREFSENYATDKNEGFILNQEALKQSGWPTPASAIGKTFAWVLPGEVLKSGKVIGIVQDFNITPLKSAVQPLVMHIAPQRFRYLYVRYNELSAREAISKVGKTFKDFYATQPFEFSFLDDTINSMYKSETRLGQIIEWFSALAIFIACMGILGLSVYSIQQRTKEIGIRKVLGAGVPGIIRKITNEFLKPVFVAAILAAPITWLVMDKWLQEFAYRIKVNPGVFVVAAAIAILIALITISFQAIKAAMANPVKSLRTE